MINSSSKGRAWLAAGFLFLAAFWQALSSYYGPLILPSPWETLRALARLAAGGELWKMTAFTVGRGLAGFVLAVAAGVPVGLALGFNSKLERAFRPALVAVQTTPLVSWLLLAMIWFGLTGSVPVFIVSITAFPLIVINTYHGVKGIDPALVEMAMVFGIKRRRIITEVYLPQLVPFLLAGFSAALGTTWKAVAMAELFSARNGVGAGMAVARMNLETSGILAWTLVLVGLGLVSDRLLMHLARSRFAFLRDFKNSGGGMGR